MKNDEILKLLSECENLEDFLSYKENCNVMDLYIKVPLPCDHIKVEFKVEKSD
jgi:hypothetical protein